jgi:hypothetical protein
MTEESDSIAGFAIQLEGNRSVWVGTKDDDYFFLFKKEGQETRMRLSHEAAEALHQLLSGHFLTDASKWTLLLSEVISEASDKTVWQEVKP